MLKQPCNSSNRLDVNGISYSLSRRLVEESALPPFLRFTSNLFRCLAARRSPNRPAGAPKLHACPHIRVPWQHQPATTYRVCPHIPATMRPFGHPIES